MGSNRCLWGLALVLGVLVGCGSTVAGTEGRDDASRTDAARDVATDATSDDRPIDERDASIDAEDPGDATPSMDADDGSTVDVTTPNDRGLTDAPTDDGPRVDVGPTGCAAATALRDGDVLTGQVIGTGERVSQCGRTFDGGTRWYRVTVPAGEVVEVTASTPSDIDVNGAVLSAQTSCEASECVASVFALRSLGPLVWSNTGAEPREVFVALSSPRGGSVWTVSARVRRRASNVTCPTAAALTEGVTLRGQDLGLAGEGPPPCTDPTATQRNPSLYYSFTVPPRAALVVDAEQESAARSNFYVDIRPPCGAPGCFATSFSLVSGGDHPRSQFNNVSNAPQAVTALLSIPYRSKDPTPVVSITARTHPLPDNVSCSQAVALTAGTPFRVERPEDAVAPLPSCPGTEPVPAGLFYAIEVPARTLLDLSASAERSLEYGALRIYTACAGACLADGALPRGGLRAQYANNDDAPRRVVVGFGFRIASQSTPTTLTATLRPSVSNASCEGAATLTLGTPIEGIDLFDAREPAHCASFSSPALYYRVTIPASARLVVDATRMTGDSEARMQLIDGCGSVCLATSSGGSSGPTTQMTYTNPGAAREVVIALGYNPTYTPGLFRLSARVE